MSEGTVGKRKIDSPSQGGGVLIRPNEIRLISSSSPLLSNRLKDNLRIETPKGFNLMANYLWGFSGQPEEIVDQLGSMVVREVPRNRVRREFGFIAFKHYVAMITASTRLCDARGTAQDVTLLSFVDKRTGLDSGYDTEGTLNKSLEVVNRSLETTQSLLRFPLITLEVIVEEAFL